MGLLKYLSIFGYLRDYDVSELFRFLFLPLTTIHGSFMFVFCELCIVYFVSMSFASFTKSQIFFRNRFTQWTRSFFGVSIASEKGLLYHRFFRSTLIWLVFLNVGLCFTIDNSIWLSISYVVRHYCDFSRPMIMEFFSSYNILFFFLSLSFHRNFSFNILGLNSCINRMSYQDFKLCFST